VHDKLSRSAIHRCLRRKGIARLPKTSEAIPSYQKFEDTPCGFIHIDLKYLTCLEKKVSYVFVAIDRATRFVYVEIIDKRDALTTAACLERFLAAFPHPVHTILTDNGSEFTDRFAVSKIGKPEDKPSGNHAFDIICTKNNIKHKLIRPFRPETNGMVERFNRRLNEAITQKSSIAKNQGRNKFFNREERNTFILNFVQNYNKTRLKCLNYKSPLEVLSNQKKLYTCAGMTFESRILGERFLTVFVLRGQSRKMVTT